MLFTTVYRLQCSNSHGCPPDLEPDWPKMRSQVNSLCRESNSLTNTLHTPNNPITITHSQTRPCVIAFGENP